MCAVDYGEPTDVARIELRKARKQHKCDDCGRIIEPRETYTHWVFLSEGYWSKGACCAHCRAASKWLVEQCGGFLYVGILDDLEEHWNEEPLLCSMRLGRLIVGCRRRWKRRDGSLMPIPAVPDREGTPCMTI